MRPDGVAIADHDVGFLRDRKVAAAARRGGLPALVAYLAVRDASWEEGARVALEDVVDTLPAVYGVELRIGELLLELGLLDAEGRIPEAVWASWFEPVRERIDRRREAGRAGGLASGAKRRETADGASSASSRTTVERPLNDRASNREPVRPSVRPSTDGTDVPSHAPAPAPEASGPSGPFSLPPKVRVDADGRPMVDDGDRRSFRERVAAHGGPVP